MGWNARAAGALSAVLSILLYAAETAAQVGTLPPAASPPDGLKVGTGAPFPKGAYGTLERLPDWGGIWFRTFSPPGPGAVPPPQPKLKGKYKAAYEAWKAETSRNNGVVKKTTSNCAPPGLPGIMSLPQYPFEFLFTPGRVTINQEAWMQTRRIWTDGRVHAQDPDPSYMGESVGHWEGDTLVADTIAIKDTLELQSGMKHSDKLHLIEHVHLKPGDPNVLIDEITMEDPEALEEPFRSTVTYGRDRYGQLLEFECSENDRNPVDANGNTLLVEKPN